MPETRSVPTALAIVIGPALAYVSYLLFKAPLSEFTQLICFGLFFMAGYDLAKCKLSLSGALFVLFLPALPVAMYLKQAVLSEGRQLSSIIIISLWLASALVGALYAGARPSDNQSNSVRRLAIMTGLLLIGLGLYYCL